MFSGGSARHLGGSGPTTVHPPPGRQSHPHLSPPLRHHRHHQHLHPHPHHPNHHQHSRQQQAHASHPGRPVCSSPRAGIHSPPGGVMVSPGGGLPASPSATFTVRAADDIPANVTVGPYLFDLALGLHMSDSRGPAEVIQARLCGGTLTVDGETSPRWLAYIQAARDRHEQTLEAFRDPRGFIFYRTVRQLRAREELLVWYGDELARECGIPVLTPTHIRGDQQYVCNTCSKSYKHPNCLKAHMRFHCSAPTRLDLLVSSRSTESWLHLTPSPPRRNLEVLRSSERPSLSPPSTNSCLSGPVNLKIGEGSAFKPPKREAEATRQSPDSTRDLPEISQERKADAQTSIKEELPSVADKRFEVPSPSKAISLKDVSPKFPVRTGMTASIPQPFQIFNHIHHTPFPMPIDNHAALKYYYAPYYNKMHGNGTSQLCYGRMLKQPTFPNGYMPESSMYFPFGAQKLHPNANRESSKIGEAVKASHHSMETAPESACLPFAFPLPSEKAGEPLDLLPRSLYMHKSRKGHLCIYCGKLYSRKYGLKIHLRTHTGYKPLKCKVCLRPFGDPSNLNKHIRLHAEGETPYRCDYCGKVLVRRRDLERHIKSRHPNEAMKLGSTDGEVSSSGKQSDLDGSASPEPEHSALSSGESVGSPSYSDSKEYIDVDDDDMEDEDMGEHEDDDDDDVDVTEIEVVA